MAQANWIDAGFASLALTDNLMKVLVQRGVITDAERGQAIDGAIADLSAAGGDVAKTADTLRAIFKRP